MDGRVRLEHELDLARIHIEAARDDQLFYPSSDRERAVIADLANVSGTEKSVVGERLPRRLGVAPVAAEYLPALQLHLIAFAKPHLDARERVTHASGLPRAVVRVGHDDATLGDAVTLYRRLAKQFCAALEERRRKRSAATDEHAHVADVGRILLEPLAKTLVHRGHAEEHRSA